MILAFTMLQAATCRRKKPQERRCISCTGQTGLTGKDRDDGEQGVIRVRNGWQTWQEKMLSSTAAKLQPDCSQRCVWWPSHAPASWLLRLLMCPSHNRRRKLTVWSSHARLHWHVHREHSSSRLQTFGRRKEETWTDSSTRGDKIPLYLRMHGGYRSRILSPADRHGLQDQCWLTYGERFHQLGAAMVAPPPHHDGPPSCWTRGSRWEHCVA